MKAPFLFALALAACTTAKDGLNAGDAGAPDLSSVGKVACGAVSCDVASGSLCCNDYVSTPSCAAACTASAGDTRHCDGPEDCANQKCCLVIGNAHSNSTCQTSCGTSAEVMCHGDVDCPIGERCCPSDPKSYPGSGVCLPTTQSC